MGVDILRQFSILIDFGLVVLIFMVQLTIYPSFLHFKRENLVNWHKIYTGRIALIVAPLMIIQLLLSLYTFVIEINIYNSIVLIAITAVWISTMLQFVPIHGKISRSTHSVEDLEKLVFKNWIRVFLWTLILIIDVALCQDML